MHYITEFKSIFFSSLLNRTEMKLPCKNKDWSSYPEEATLQVDDAEMDSVWIQRKNS